MIKNNRVDSFHETAYCVLPDCIVSTGDQCSGAYTHDPEIESLVLSIIISLVLLLHANICSLCENTNYETRKLQKIHSIFTDYLGFQLCVLLIYYILQDTH